jgi:hypothetical protein
MMDMLLIADAIETLKEGKETYGSGKQEAIDILKEWDCDFVYLKFESEKSVTFINPDTSDNFSLNIMDTVH